MRKKRAHAQPEHESLRERAEAQISSSPPVEEALAASTALVHELQVHKVELEMQNESLRQTHAELEQAHDRYLDLYELSPVGYLTLTLEGRIAEINRTGVSLLGNERVPLIGRRFGDLLVGEDAPRWASVISALASRGGSRYTELALAEGNGGVTDVRVDCRRVQRGDERLAIHVTLTDISERRQAESDLREREEFFRLIAENLNGFIAVLDVEGQRIYSSPSYKSLLGERESAGTNSFADVHPADRERIEQVFRETVATGIGHQVEYRFRLPDGRLRLMESRGGVIRNREGRVERVVVVSHDVTERSEADEKIHHLAFHDSLTQLLNRQAFGDRLQQAMAASKRSGRYGALMYLDFDYFKPLNDAHGHGAGDRLLVQAARRITQCVREVDTVARFGGDEFVVLLGELDVSRGASVANARVVADKIRESIAVPYLLEVGGGGSAIIEIEHRCTATIGVALFRGHAQSGDEVLRAADSAMYRAKEEGRNRIGFDFPSE